MKRVKNVLRTLIPSIIGSGLTIAVFLLLGLHTGKSTIIQSKDETTAVHQTGFSVVENGMVVPLDFTGVSKQVMNSVVHIKSVRKIQANNPNYMRERNPFEDFFGDQLYKFFYGDPDSQNNGRSYPKQFEQASTGSGVIISTNGYIVTNNHVIDNANEIEVTLHDNNSYKAKVIGTDPSTDIAVLQIRGKDLPAIPFGNSDDVEVGEWVVAVGNPFNLNSTVTAGIVSAKGRNINIIDDKSAIEAFIQTDAAINPGNSGGALVNLQGELIGVNTAIASPTGTYTGYGFAVPVTIVGKVVEDIIEYGSVQRGFLGVMIRDVNGTLKTDKKLEISEGAYVDSVLVNSAAAEAGIEVGDVITKVNGNEILKTSDLLEQIGRHRPGDEVAVAVNRNGKEKTYQVVLANQDGEKKLVKKEDMDILDILGGSFETLDEDLARQLGIKGGVRIDELKSGLLKNQTSIKEGFIIIGVDNEKIKSVEDLKQALKKRNGGVMLEGIYENFPGEVFYAFGMPEK